MSVNIGRNIRANSDIYASQRQNISELLNFVIFLYMLSRKITYRTNRIMRKKLQLRSRSFQTAQINLPEPICIFKAKRLNFALEFAIAAPINLPHCRAGNRNTILNLLLYRAVPLLKFTFCSQECAG